MNDFALVVAIACIVAFLTYLGAPVAERFDIPHRAVSAALQFAGGVIVALVVLVLMPPAVRYGDALAVTLAFFVGGALFVVFEYYSARRLAAQPHEEVGVTSIGMYAGILIDLVIDGVLIGLASTLTLNTGVPLALGIAVSTAPLAFVTIATAKRQGFSPKRRRILSYVIPGCVIVGAVLGYAVFRDQSEGVRLTLLALGAGFLLTTVTQSIIPEANREGEPSFAGILFIGGLTLFALLSLAVK